HPDANVDGTPQVGHRRNSRCGWLVFPVNGGTGLRVSCCAHAEESADHISEDDRCAETAARRNHSAALERSLRAPFLLQEGRAKTRIELSIVVGNFFAFANGPA